MLNKKQQYLDFYSFQSLLANKERMTRLVSEYQNIFGDPELWNESYTKQEVLHSLRDQLAGKAGIRLCVENDVPSKLIGFCWAQLLSAHEIEKSIQAVQYYQTLGDPDIRRVLRSIVGTEAVIYLHDLGVSAEHRGQVSLQQLIYPLLASLAQRTQTRRVFFWSIGGTRIYRLAERAGFQLAAEVFGMQFFIGNLAVRDDAPGKDNTRVEKLYARPALCFS